ncbi:CHAT domain-containing protein, partial [Mycena rosella]
LAACFTERYWRSGSIYDLQEAIENNQLAVYRTEEDHSEYSNRIQNLATTFRLRYRRSGNRNDLITALDYNRTAVEKQPQDPSALQNLAASLTELYWNTNDLQHLQQALEENQRALHQTHMGCPEYIQRLQNNLALSFKAQYDISNKQDDLEKAVESIKFATYMLPKDSPRRHHCLQNWAMMLLAKFAPTNDITYLKGASDKFEESFESPISQFLWTLDAAQTWESIEEGLGYLDVEHKNYTSPNLRAHAVAFDLLSDVLWMGNSLSVRQVGHRKMQIAHTTSDALRICIMEGKLRRGIEFAEKGSAMIFQQRLQLNKCTHKLLAPEDAKALEAHSIQLVSQMHTDPCQVRIARQKLLETIRRQPGLDKFLLPRQYSDLCQVSQNGPVIILNSHPRSCDAIILVHPASEPIYINLEITLVALQQAKKTLKKLLASCNSRNIELNTSRLSGDQYRGVGPDPQQGLSDVLRWLQSCIISPIYQVLKANNVPEKRLWWCPLGMFVGLPLHAADISDRFIQSYTPSLGVLLNAMKETENAPKPKIGVVGVSINSGHETLSHVAEEIERIAAITRKHNVELYMPSSLQATVTEVKKQLQTCTWVHFACHGVQNPVDPVKSFLQLYDTNLNLESILEMSLPNAEFVFLAACQTAKGDVELVNESLHLGGAFIAAGFKAAIGTMWTMMDEDGPIIAEGVYGHLFNEARLQKLKTPHPKVADTAEALQIAVRKLRDSGVPYERWMPFIHIGV